MCPQSGIVFFFFFVSEHLEIRTVMAIISGDILTISGQLIRNVVQMT